MLAELKQKSQLTIPKEITEKLELKIGDSLQIDLVDNKIVITPIAIIPKDEAWFYNNIWQKIKKKKNVQKQLSTQIEIEMIQAGYTKAYAKKHAKAFQDFLEAEKNNQLTAW